MTNWLDIALQIGFDRAVNLDPQRLTCLKEVREMCSANRCRSYDKNWMCPPACGDLTECQERIQSCSSGLLVQTIGKLEKEIDSKGYAKAMELHTLHFRDLAGQMACELPQALFLGSGPCTYCKTCVYPEPCRFPDRAISSMEAYGLFVTQVCRDSDVAYYNGPKTITYTGCILW